MREFSTESLICLADIHKLPATTMQIHLIAISNDVPVPGITTNTKLDISIDTKTAMDHTKVEPRISSNISRDDKNHSNANLEEHELTDLDKCRINDENDCEYEYDRRSSTTGDERCESLKKAYLYGNEPITRRRIVNDDTKRAPDLKFKCARDGREWMDPIGRTMGRVRAIAVVGLLLAVLVTSTAAPAKSRSTRSHHHEKSARSYLENFGYLRKGKSEVSNLVMGDQMQSYEDDFRIAIKTLQEFGGISVTGEIDSETLQLMKQKRCGRPDREEGDEESHRRKRFAIQGSKWEHTNLTWSLSQDKKPSQLDAGYTRAVLSRALDVWQQASTLTFTEISSNQADIVVSFAKRYHDDAYPFDGRGSILAHAFFPGSGRGGDAHFDDDELWLLQPKNDDEEGTSLFAVAAHEFGHSLGLSHSSVRGALMFPWYQGIQSNFILPEDDRNGIQQMYGEKEPRKWGTIPKFPKETPPPPTTTTSTTTTTRRPNRHNTRYPGRYPAYRPNYTPYPREPSRHPSHQPERPERPHHRPAYPDFPSYYPTRHKPTSEDHPRRTNHHPRPTETTTIPTTYRPRYPVREYPNYRPNTPTDPRQDYPKRPYYPEKTTTYKPTTTTLKPDIPDACDTSYDAVALIRNELFIFKGKYHWRIGAHGRYEGYPMEIRRMWGGLPRNLTRVDAVYERPDQNIAIFVGKQLYLFNVQSLMPGYPKSLYQLGLPPSLNKLDAAMVWGHNSKTYFYSGMEYWKYDEDVGSVEPDYPRNMAMWKGVGYNIDSVFQWKDGKTYFFKGKGFWKFNDLQMRVEREKQLPSAQFWMGCQPDRQHGTKSPLRVLPPPGSTRRSPSASDPNASKPSASNPSTTEASVSDASVSDAPITSINLVLPILSSTILLLRSYSKCYQ